MRAAREPRAITLHWRLNGMTGVTRLTIAVILTIAVTGCVHVPLRDRAAVRIDAYLATRPELPPSIATAIRNGHVIAGMNHEQVWVVLGDPIQRRTFGLNPPIGIWLYPAHKLHQDQLRTHGASSFRLVFLGDRLVVIEPI